MKKIFYKTSGTMLVAGPNGDLVPKPVEASVEAAYSESALQYAETVAIPGSIVILGDDAPAKADTIETPEPINTRLLLQDRATGKIYEIYVENGKLMMEVL